jgi:trimeric autotransporter adhesin
MRSQGRPKQQEKKIMEKEMKTVKKFIHVSIAILTIACLGLSPIAQALIPAPDGNYPGGNTAEGQNALFNLTSGDYNTAVGFFSLRSNTEGQFNTAVGAGALFANTSDGNTATGVAALFSNASGGDNTADGVFALFHNTTGANNTAVGTNALVGNTDGNDNTGIGAGALLEVTEGNRNVAVGLNALGNRPGDNNVALGNNAGVSQDPPTTPHSNNNIYIGYNIHGVADESNACYIGSIFTQIAVDNPVPVFVTMSNKLGTNTSSRRFKEQIKPMDKASDALFALKPVTFRYKREIDPAGKSQFGLVAEEVEKVNRDLVVRDKEGKPYSVRYDQINAMLLNEFLKEHKKVEAQGCKLQHQAREIQQQHATIAQLKDEMASVAASVKGQASQIQKVSGQLEMSKPASKVVANNQ